MRVLWRRTPNSWQCLVASCRKETEARTTENLQELRDRILEIESDWVAVEILGVGTFFLDFWAL